VFASGRRRANWAFGRFLVHPTPEIAGQQSRDVYAMALYHKEHEIACVRLHGGWPARVGVGS
jgi:hypothetical protein